MFKTKAERERERAEIDRVVRNVDESIANPPPLPVLPPFTGEDPPPCEKCGATEASTTYLGYGQCLHSDGVGGLEILGSRANPRLHRECGRCHFAWDEATI